MKTNLKIGMVAALLSLSACSDDLTPQQTYEPNQPVSFQVFYNQLTPYGMWVNYPAYGYVWIPDVAWGFSPYATNGQWVYSSYGWTWNSYYSWGWAPFHYGRWFFDGSYGWMWLPDTIWSPAWVAWRNGGGYYGWAPLSPGISVNVVITGGNVIPNEHWVFVRDGDFSNRYIERHRVDRTQNSSLVQKATMMRNVREERNAVYLPGPERTEIQRVSKKAINPVEIVDRNQPGNERVRDNKLEIFRPKIDRDIKPESRKPERIYDLKEIENRSDGQTIHRQGQIKTPSSFENRPTQPRIRTQPRVRETGPATIPRTNPPRTVPRKKNN